MAMNSRMAREHDRHKVALVMARVPWWNSVQPGHTIGGDLDSHDYMG